MRATRRSVVLAMAAAGVLSVSGARAYCPSYTKAAGCAVDPVAGKNPDAATLRLFFDKVGTGTFTSAEGPAVPLLTRGCGQPSAETKAPAEFPCHVLYAIAEQESDWTQFCVPESPQSAVGSPERTIVSFDCGFGIAQVTSGMRQGESPTFDQKRVASDALYNLIVGVRILRDKWQAVECVGDRDPEVVEHWYSALWAYNGLSYKNNPNNPAHSPGRNVYDPQNGGSYPYQEKLLGLMEFPSDARWESILPAYPNRGEIGTGSSPKALTEPKCATPTSCVRTRTVNASSCKPPVPPVADAGAPPPVTPPEPAAPDAGDAVLPAEEDVPVETGCSCHVVGAPAATAFPQLLLVVGVAACCVRVRPRRQRRRR